MSTERGIRKPSGQARENRQHTRELVGGGQRVGAGAGRLAADVDQVGAIGFHSQCGGDGSIGIDVGPSLGERVGRDVENPHDERPFPQVEDHAVGKGNGARVPAGRNVAALFLRKRLVQGRHDRRALLLTRTRLVFLGDGGPGGGRTAARRAAGRRPDA